MDREEATGVPDRVPEAWVAMYGSRQTTASQTTPSDGRDHEASLARLVTWLVAFIGVAAVVAWFFVGGPGIVAVVVPAVAIGGGGVLVLRWLVRTGPDDDAAN
jgi:hypothetical protein